jgi:hypothetical protein
MSKEGVVQARRASGIACGPISQEKG